jgi:hypothetical protein
MRASLATLAAFAALAGAAASPAFVVPSLAPARETRLSAARGACRARLPALQVNPTCALQGARARKWGGVGVGWWMGAARAALCGVFPGARRAHARGAFVALMSSRLRR